MRVAKMAALPCRLDQVNPESTVGKLGNAPMRPKVVWLIWRDAY